jgi:hypothetical protein
VKNYTHALDYIWHLPFSQAQKNVKKYGKGNSFSSSYLFSFLFCLVIIILILLLLLFFQFWSANCQRKPPSFSCLFAPATSLVTFPMGVVPLFAKKTSLRLSLLLLLLLPPPPLPPLPLLQLPLRVLLRVGLAIHLWRLLGSHRRLHNCHSLQPRHHRLQPKRQR